MAVDTIIIVIGAVVGYLYLYSFSQFDPAQLPISQPDSELRSHYDFIIIGSGPSGSVLANRLSENPRWSVLLMESGGFAPVSARVPLFSEFYSSAQSPIRTQYVTDTQSLTCQDQGGQCAVFLSSSVGGGSESNDMLYLRGNKADYDSWGIPGWSYNDVLPLFKKSENIAIAGLTAGLYHGAGGPVTVSVSPYSSGYPLTAALTSALNSLGYQALDLNGASQNGYSLAPVTESNGLRVSATTAFLQPARSRPNLDIITGVSNEKIILDPSKTIVKAVTYTRNNVVKTIGVSKELILSAGALNTAKVLMLSGIGPAADLQALNISVVRNLPVGANLQDQLKVTLMVGLNSTLGTPTVFTLLDAISYATNFNGLMTSTGTEVVANFNGTGPTPSVRLTISNPLGQFIQGISSQNFAITATLTKPKSKGTIKLVSANPSTSPRLNPQYLSDAADLPNMVAGVQAAMDIVYTPTMQAQAATIITALYPSCNITAGSSNFAACLIKYYGQSSSELVGSCKMGVSSDSTSVVDPKLRVKGFKNLRVADESIIPSHTTGNTNTNGMMIGEKAANLIKSTWN